jgi:hypothetical protein
MLVMDVCSTRVDTSPSVATACPSSILRLLAGGGRDDVLESDDGDDEREVGGRGRASRHR